MCISVNGELVRAVSLSSAPGWGVTASCIPWDLGRLLPQLCDQRWWWQQGAQGMKALWVWPKSCHQHLQESRWGLFFYRLAHSFVMERWFGACFCMMALPIQNVPWEQLLFNSFKKRQLVTYCPQAMFYSLYGVTGMFSNVVYSPSKCFYLYGRHLAASLNVKVFQFEMDGQFRMISCNFFPCLVFVDPNSIYVIII